MTSPARWLTSSLILVRRSKPSSDLIRMCEAEADEVKALNSFWTSSKMPMRRLVVVVEGEDKVR